MEKRVKDITVTIGIIVACCLILSLWGFYWAIKPIRISSSITPANFKIPYENIELRTKDNILIRGWFIPNANPHAKTIILLHGYPADMGNILPSRLFLHEKYNLLFINFRYFGTSEGNYSTVGKNEVLDVLAAIKFLKERGLNDIGIWGFSLGGAVAIMTAEVSPDVKAIVAEASFANLTSLSYDYFKIPLLKYPLGLLLRLWGWLFLGYDINSVSPMKSAATLTIPVLLIHSKNDNVIPFKNSEILKKALHHDPKVEVLFFNDLHHGEAPPNYQKVVQDFFDRSL